MKLHVAALGKNFPNDSAVSHPWAEEQRARPGRPVLPERVFSARPAQWGALLFSEPSSLGHSQGLWKPGHSKQTIQPSLSEWSTACMFIEDRLSFQCLSLVNFASETQQHTIGRDFASIQSIFSEAVYFQDVQVYLFSFKNTSGRKQKRDFKALYSEKQSKHALGFMFGYFTLSVPLNNSSCIQWQLAALVKGYGSVWIKLVPHEKRDSLNPSCGQMKITSQSNRLNFANVEMTEIIIEWRWRKNRDTFGDGNIRVEMLSSTQANITHVFFNGLKTKVKDFHGQLQTQRRDERDYNKCLSLSVSALIQTLFECIMRQFM